MKYIITILFVIAVGCAKTIDRSAIVPKQPVFRLNKMRVRTDQSMHTVVFLYDHRNRIILRKIMETGKPLEQFVYDGNELKTIIFYDATGNIASVNDHPMYSSDFGKVLSFYYLSPSANGGLDTNNLIYQFNESRITDIKKSIRPANSPGITMESHAQFVYDAQWNLSQYSCIGNGVLSDEWSVTATDDKNNPVKHLSPLVFIFGELPQYSGMGSNNVIKLEKDGEVVEFEYTYNEYGFPTSIRNKRENFARWEFEYSE